MVRAALLTVASLLVVTSARAEWLVTRAGARIETRGPFAIEGEHVRFVDAHGRPQTLPVADVDVTASRKASAPADGPQSLPRVASPEATGSRSPLAAAAASAHQARGNGAAPVAVLRDGDVATIDPAIAAVALKPGERAEQIVLYGTTWCPWCKKARRLLAGLGANWIEKDTEHTPGAQAELDALVGPGAGVPVIALGVRTVRGYDETAIIALVLKSRLAQRELALPSP